MKTLEQGINVSLTNVLLATDLGQSSAMALRIARAFGREPGVHVHTLHVSGSDNYQLLCPEAFSATFNGPNKNGGDTETLRGLLEGLPCEVPVHGGQVWEVIADVVERNEIDLLILGTHGRKGFRKLLFGSVAEEVFRHVSCPVLTVGSDIDDPGSSGLEINAVLLATDFNPHSVAPAYAQLLCERFKGRLTVLHVAGKNESYTEETLKRLMHDQLAAPPPYAIESGHTPAFLVEHGEPAAKILQAAEELDADVIVLGAHHPRDTRAASHSPWATAARVVSDAKCPVLTVRD